ncbi:MAG: c-type cytochrome [Oculatellaceae cyanobacterium Prado106]|jgi:cytochrome c6|nr:c-type cytochrome [Oculatellaceae cyanobacterium Prado106]
MKFFRVQISVVAIALTLCFTFLLITPTALASPTESTSLDGATLFENTCAGCHINGGNIIRRGKNLKLKTLQKNQMDSTEAIAQIITQGKGIMSAYGDRLTPEEIAVIATYVLEQAENDWRS